MKTLKHWFYKIFLPHRLKIQTFTYYVPAPPSRKSGYREKEFDRIFYSFINQGYEVLSVNTEAISDNGQSGLWIIVTARGLEPKNVYCPTESFEEQLVEEVPIEGMYYIEDE